METATDFKILLQHELSRRCAQNPSYSLRAFAKALSLSPAYLSLILSGKRLPSFRRISRILESLSFSPTETEQVLNHHRMQKYSFGALTPIHSEFQQLSLDRFAVISDWYHYAILSLLDIKGCRFEAQWIAARLGISQTQAKLAMERLIRLGLVEEVKGKWKQAGLPLKVENTVSTSATRKFHRQFLEKAAFSLENDPIEVRDFSAMTFAMDASLIPYAKEKIREFRRALAQELESKATPRKVYHMAVQLYPVSSEGEGK